MKPKNEAQELIKKYNIPVKSTGATITQFDVIRSDGPNKNISIIRDADVNIMQITERDLYHDLF